MNELKVTLELCAEDRTRLDRILAALENVTAPVVMTSTISAEAEKPAEKAPKVELPANTQPQPEPVKEEAKPTATKAEIRSKVVALVGAKKKAEVEAIIKAYAPSVTELPDDKLDEVMQKLTELEKGVS